MWYEDKYRRHLCDMHMDDWSEEFLSRFSPEEYFENLKTAKIQNAMLYFQSHVGLCYYPTRVGRIHNAFRGQEDAMQRLVKLCRENGIAVTGYYSLIYNNWAYHEHPEWRMIPEKGEPEFGESNYPTAEKSFASNHLNRYGFCCPNNKGYRSFVSEQIKEICEYFEFDGMFFDMLFWPRRCRCDACLARFKEETGYDMPEEENWSDPLWRLHIAKRREWMGQFAQSVTDEVKAYVPHVSVEHNAASAATSNAKTAQGEEVLDACDYAGGDLYGGVYHQSFTCKFYRNITKNQPFEYMPSRCEPNLSRHTITKSEDTLSSIVFLTLAHHGATLVIDAMDPVGTLDKRVYQRLGKVFGRSMCYEKYLTGTMVEDIGIYYTMHSKFNTHGEACTNYTGSINSVIHMVKKNICCGVTGAYHDLDKYPVLIASCLTEEDRSDYSRITEYVRKGGKLYLSGGNCEGLLKEFFGAEISGRTHENIVYIAPEESAEVSEAFGWFNKDYPLQFEGTAPIATGIKTACVAAKITLPYTPQDTVKFASIHSNPPGVRTEVPAVAVTEYGKGKVLWSALPIETIETPYQYGEVFVGLLKQLLGIFQNVISDAPEDVEVIAFKDKQGITVSAVQLCEGAHARPVERFQIHVRVDKKPQKLLQFPEEKECEFEYRDAMVTYSINNLQLFDMRKIIF